MTKYPSKIYGAFLQYDDNKLCFEASENLMDVFGANPTLTVGVYKLCHIKKIELKMKSIKPDKAETLSKNDSQSIEPQELKSCPCQKL